MTDLLAGQVDAFFDNLPTSLEHIRAGTVRPLAVTTKARSPALPDLPALGEFVPGYEVSSWFGIAAPKDTPAEIITLLSGAINAGLADRKIAARIAELASEPMPTTPAQLATLIADDTAKWAKVVKFAGLTPADR